jgi:hypothetical protein
MALTDAYFRNEKAGRVVVFPWNRRNRGYVVRSEAEELKIRSFLKMFNYAYFSILLLGYFLASEWSRELSYALGRPAKHLLRTGGTFLGIYFLVVGVPYFFLWRTYKKAYLSFVSAQDQVLVSGKRAGQQPWIVIGVALIALGILILFGIIFFIRAR